MQLVQREVHEFGEVAFDHQVFADHATHHVAHCAEFTQGDQGAKISVVIGLKRLVGEPALDLMEQVGRLLMGRLSAWRNNASTATLMVRAWASGAITQCKNIRVQRCFQRIFNHQLVYSVGFQTTKIFQEIGRFDAGSPDHQL